MVLPTQLSEPIPPSVKFEASRSGGSGKCRVLYTHSLVDIDFRNWICSRLDFYWVLSLNSGAEVEMDRLNQVISIRIVEC